mmetsp:Transcript_7585/g.9401  ORF Transcript_7585/g.9401 Transcript_7585/m.9401 type:complete len:209 (-) Transcript_7585:946-1572(-)
MGLDIKTWIIPLPIPANISSAVESSTFFLFPDSFWCLCFIFFRIKSFIVILMAFSGVIPINSACNPRYNFIGPSLALISFIISNMPFFVEPLCILVFTLSKGNTAVTPIIEETPPRINDSWNFIFGASAASAWRFSHRIEKLFESIFPVFGFANKANTQSSSASPNSTLLSFFIDSRNSSFESFSVWCSFMNLSIGCICLIKLCSARY